MQRFRSLIADTWWLWLIFILAGTILTTLLSKVFLLTIPICIFTFLWFAYVRYDEDGNFKGT